MAAQIRTGAEPAAKAVAHTRKFSQRSLTAADALAEGRLSRLRRSCHMRANFKVSSLDRGPQIL